MARLLITSGPTREYLDPVRYLSNGASGRMGSATATEAIVRGHSVVVVSGPVHREYPTQARVIPVVTTEQMLLACQSEFPSCDCLVAIAAPCDYRPRHPAHQKIAKTGQSIQLELIETPDIVATLANHRQHQRIVGFSLETHDHRAHAMAKLKRKRCDLIVVNDASAVDAENSSVEILDGTGEVIAHGSGSKQELATILLDAIERILP